MKYVSAFSATVGMVIGNYLAQLIQTQPDWNKAAERSFFQVIAVIVVMIPIVLAERNQDLVP